jgi:glycosyltransferase involved in cell wall biosynthesis
MRIICTVTNGLCYDQRMHRIAGSLSDAGCEVCLVGRRTGKAPAERSFKQERLFCFWQKGPMMYLEFSVRLTWFLLWHPADIICAIDLDTILPVWLVTTVKRQKRVYDAHELFTEQKEIVTRPRVKKLWGMIARFGIPRFPKGYTVNDFIAAELKKKYGVDYAVIRNLPVYRSLPEQKEPAVRFLLYQGAVNEGRSFETLLPAMQQIPLQLVICGEGNFLEKAKALVKDYGLADKALFKGALDPETLWQLTPTAWLGITLFEATGLNQYQSLANRFFDYTMAGIPQLCVNYPEYKRLNDLYQVALTVPDTRPETLADAVNYLLVHPDVYENLRRNCLRAREVLNWEKEVPTLLQVYDQL